MLLFDPLFPPDPDPEPGFGEPVSPEPDPTPPTPPVALVGDSDSDDEPEMVDVERVVTDEADVVVPKRELLPNKPVAVEASVELLEGKDMLVVMPVLVGPRIALPTLILVVGRAVTVKTKVPPLNGAENVANGAELAEVPLLVRAEPGSGVAGGDCRTTCVIELAVAAASVLAS